MVFRFGNQGTLESQHALVVPIGPLKLKIAIVPGRTPFLLSKTLLRAIGATVDISGEVIKSTLLKRNIPIQLNAKGLFLVDLNDLITPASQDAEAEPAETFARDSSLRLCCPNCYAHPASRLARYDAHSADVWPLLAFLGLGPYQPKIYTVLR